MEKGNKKDYQKLYRAILSLKNEEECQAFFEDLYTISELDAAAQRLKVAGMLHKKYTCGHISEVTGASTATVSRVNQCLNYGSGGYRMVLARLEDGEDNK